MTTLQEEMLGLDLPVIRGALDFFQDADAESRGAIHTRPEVAAFILDLAGWVESAPLSSCRLLEPSCGEGDFLLPAVKRLLAHAVPNSEVIAACITAVEVSRAALERCRQRLVNLMIENGWRRDSSEAVVDRWLVHADFLTHEFGKQFTHVVGNPPYLRLEALPKPLLRLYRSQWKSLFDRADLYVAFFEKSLTLLAPDGRLGFVCADRWMKNRYGGPLRAIIADGFHLESYVDLTGCAAFFDEVDAYPAITVFRRGKGVETRTAYRPPIEDAGLKALVPALTGRGFHTGVSVRDRIARGDEPWHFDEHGHLEIIRKIEESFPPMEEVGVRVGIGVATGADGIFIGKQLDVEPERKLPLVTTRDIRSGSVNWSGNWVLNPFEDDGTVVDLKHYPKFAAYVLAHRERIASRNVASRAGTGWYRTIDRIHASLTGTPKLLIPDIKGSAHVVLEEGKFYPHHNLYYLVSSAWDLRALRTVVSSRIGQAFILSYSPRMRGGHLRFQAQYLRRIRLPAWDGVSQSLQNALILESEDAVRTLFRLSREDWEGLGKAAKQSASES